MSKECKKCIYWNFFDDACVRPGCSGVNCFTAMESVMPGLLGGARSAKASSKQVGGSHYKDFKIQPMEFFQANQTPYDQAAVIKYVMRHEKKGKRQDLEKAKHILDMMIEYYYPEK